jgi:hypothetical protein
MVLRQIGIATETLGWDGGMKVQEFSLTKANVH